jgi:hypothetical protein
MCCILEIYLYYINLKFNMVINKLKKIGVLTAALSTLYLGNCVFGTNPNEKFDEREEQLKGELDAIRKDIATETDNGYSFIKNWGDYKEIENSRVVRILFSDDDLHMQRLVEQEGTMYPVFEGSIAIYFKQKEVNGTEGTSFFARYARSDYSDISSVSCDWNGDGIDATDVTMYPNCNSDLKGLDLDKEEGLVHLIKANQRHLRKMNIVRKIIDRRYGQKDWNQQKYEFPRMP